MIAVQRAKTFYVSVLLATVVAVVVVGATTVVAQWQRPVPDDDDGYHPVPSTSAGVLAEGTHFLGDKWELMAYESNEGLCMDLRVHGTGGTHGACGLELSDGSGIDYVRSRDKTGEYIYGPVASGATAVRLRALDEIVSIGVQLVPAPPDMDAKTSFYIAAFPPGLPATHIDTVEAVDADGSVIASVELRTPPIVNPWLDPPPVGDHED